MEQKLKVRNFNSTQVHTSRGVSLCVTCMEPGQEWCGPKCKVPSVPHPILNSDLLSLFHYFLVIELELSLRVNNIRDVANQNWNRNWRARLRLARYLVQSVCNLLSWLRTLVHSWSLQSSLEAWAAKHRQLHTCVQHLSQRLWRPIKMSIIWVLVPIFWKKKL